MGQPVRKHQQSRMLLGLRKRLQEKARLKLPASEVEDIVQDVLLVVAEKLQENEVETLQAYAEGILRHKIYDHYQKRSRRVLTPFDSTVEVVSTNASPEEQVLWRRHIKVIQGVAEENRLDRAILNDHFANGAPLREVASNLGVSAGAVNGRLYRFRQKVMQHVGTCFAFVLSLGIGTWSRISKAWTVVRAGTTAAWTTGLSSLSAALGWFLFFSGGPVAPPQKPVQQQPLSWTQPATVIPATHIIKKKTAALPMVKEEFVPMPAIREENGTLFGRTAKTAMNVRVSTLLDDRTASVQSAVMSMGDDTSTKTSSNSKKQQWVLPLIRTKSFAKGRVAPVQKAMVSGSRSVGTVSGASGGSSTVTAGHHGSRGTVSHSNSSGSTGSGSVNSGKAVVAGLDTPRGDAWQNPGTAPGVDVGTLNPGGSLPTGIGTPNQQNTGETSFAMRQDGSVYQFSNGSYTDIAGLRTSRFSCGDHSDCKKVIGHGPSLLFQKDGHLIIVGEGFYRISRDSGKTWEQPDQAPKPDAVLKVASFVLNQSNIIWNQQTKGWTQLRKALPSIQEVRVKLSSQVHFEDDNGFAMKMSWTSKARLDQMKKQTEVVDSGKAGITKTEHKAVKTQGMQNPNSPNTGSKGGINPFLPTNTTTPTSSF